LPPIFRRRILETARAAIGEEAFETAFREGQAMRLKKEIASAREKN